MSKQYPGGIISKTAPVPSGPYASSTAPGVWTLEQQAYWQKLGQWPTQGAVNPNVFIENLFSTYLYTGDSSTQTITNGIDLSTNGGMVWIKARQQTDGSTSPIGEHGLWDTNRGVGTSGSVNKALSSNATSAQNLGWTDADYISAFNTTGFTVQNAGGTTAHRIANHAFQNYASWTFRKQPKFFDVVTYTGNGVAGRTVAHNLGSAPGFIVCKRIDSPDEWFCYHRSLGPSQQILLNSTAASGTNNNQWNNTAPTASVFSLGTDSGANGTGGTYVAYLFAHNAGGFGLSGTENVISCGSMAVGGGVDAVVNLGYEPQWVMFKQAQVGGSGNWRIVDNMRGVPTGTTTGDKIISANLATAETDAGANLIDFTSTGFIVKDNVIQGGDPYIYIAIRRGPMKVPTSGTSVFSPVAYTGDGGSPKAINAGFVADAAWGRGRTDTFNWNQVDRLRGSPRLSSNATSSEATSVYGNPTWDTMTGLNGVNGGTDNSNYNQSSMGYIFDVFKRAPSFFDVVCYTGTGTSTAFNHNLTVVPEMIITKIRNSAVPNWGVWHNALSPSSAMLFLNTTGTQGNGYVDTVTSTTFSFATANGVVNSSGNTYVAYLFATCAGVSKVGSYTGTATTKQIDCGFTGGARFVLIRRTDSTGDWYVWDSARGIVAGNDPYLLLNSTAAEVTNTDYVDTYSAGFEISSTAPAAINATGGTYIFLAIA